MKKVSDNQFSLCLFKGVDTRGVYLGEDIITARPIRGRVCGGRGLMEELTA